MNTQAHSSLRLPKRIAKVKPTHLYNPNQSTLLNECGFPHFRVETDARPVDEQPGVYDVQGMRVQLLPLPRDSTRALLLTMDSVRLVHFSRPAWKHSRPYVLMPLTLDTWGGETCAVSFRQVRDDGVIRATYDKGKGHLDLSMPHQAMWRTCGLGWLGKDHDCCERNAENPTPWLGRQCGCESRVKTD